MKILLVDDVTQMRIKTKILLNTLGFEDINESANGVQALEEMQRTGPYDLVFMDWNMPVKTGPETVVEIRSNPLYNDVKIVMLTSQGKKEEVLSSIAAGADSYLIKPITATTLEKCIKSL